MGTLTLATPSGLLPKSFFIAGPTARTVGMYSTLAVGASIHKRVYKVVQSVRDRGQGTWHPRFDTAMVTPGYLPYTIL